MKKFLCLAFCLIMALGVVACGDNSTDANADNVTSKVADSKTVELVNDAYKATYEAINSATALGYEQNIKLNITTEGQSVTGRVSEWAEFMMVDGKREMSAKAEMAALGTKQTILFYETKDKVYGNANGTTYVIAKSKSATAALEEIYKERDMYNAEAIKAIDTTIVNTASEGYGFVIEYDVNALPSSFTDIFGDLYNKADLLNRKPVSMKISGLIDKNGLITQETVTYNYTYQEEYIANENEIDPDNSVVDGTEVKKELRTISVELIAEYIFDYEVTEVEVPDDIEKSLVPDEVKKIKEISIEDFQKLLTDKK